MPPGVTKKTGQTIRPGKDITEAEMDTFLPKLADSLEQCAGNLTIDCSRINGIDAVGAAVLLRAHNTCRDAGGKLALAHVGDGIMNIFRILGLDRHFDLKPKRSQTG